MTEYFDNTVPDQPPHGEHPRPETLVRNGRRLVFFTNVRLAFPEDSPDYLTGEKNVRAFRVVMQNLGFGVMPEMPAYMRDGGVLEDHVPFYRYEEVPEAQLDSIFFTMAKSDPALFGIPHTAEREMTLPEMGQVVHRTMAELGIEAPLRKG